jgi:superfamily II DNA or RNA helicase
MKIKKISKKDNNEDVVYDLEVKDNHNYFVEDVLVHNCHGASSKTGDKTSKSKKSGGTVMRQICDLCSNATWRFGFTGTMPTDPLDYRTVISGIGPVKNEVKASELMDKGHVTRLKIVIPFIEYDSKIANEKIKENLLEMGVTEETNKDDIPKNAKFNAEKKFIEKYIPRMKLIAKIAKSRLQKDENILILANTIEFGTDLQKVLSHLLKNEMNELYYISGEMDEYKRKEIRAEMENKTRVVVIATTSLFSTGISVRNLHSAIFSSMGKSKVRTIQSVGRCLRQHSSKKIARIFDIVDDLKYSKKHAQERLNFYSEEEYDHEIFEVSI